MRKILLIGTIFIMLASSAFAQNLNHNVANANAGAAAFAEASVNNANANYIGIGIADYNSQQLSPNQTMMNSGNQSQVINAPGKVVVGTAPQDSGQSELNFIAPNERDVTKMMPKFGCGTMKELKPSDCVMEVVWQANDVKFKHLYNTILKGLQSSEVKGYKFPMRMQIWEAASTKTWDTGGNLSANGVGGVASGIGGGSAGLVPKIGRSKSSNLYTIFIVGVQEFK